MNSLNICKDNYTFIWGQHIPYNAWYGQDEIGFWFCTVHAKSYDNTLELRRFDGKSWIKVIENSRTTMDICQWATSKNLWWTKVHWFKEDDAKLILVAKHYNNIDGLAAMMKHSRKRKKNGLTGRLEKENFYASKIFTDYECSSNPLHDFRRY